MAVRDAGHHAAVIEVYDRAVVAHFAALQEQVGEVRAPFLVGSLCREVLFQSVLEHFMRLPGLRAGLPGTDDGAQAQLCVHVFMDGRGAVAVSPALQVCPHAAVAINAVVAVVDGIDFLQHSRFLGVVTSFPVLTVVVIGIWTDPQPPQQPADAELHMVLVDEMVSL